MSAMAVAKHGDVFKAGIAGAPVTSWDGYDTHYTERYMSLPADNPDGYRESSVMSHVHTMPDTAALLLIHGLLDENVHWRHSEQPPTQAALCVNLRCAALTILTQGSH
jgi:dipeptidyl-peptidase-4